MNASSDLRQLRLAELSTPYLDRTQHLHVEGVWVTATKTTRYKGGTVLRAGDRALWWESSIDRFSTDRWAVVRYVSDGKIHDLCTDLSKIEVLV